MSDSDDTDYAIVNLCDYDIKIKISIEIFISHISYLVVKVVDVGLYPNTHF